MGLRVTEEMAEMEPGKQVVSIRVLWDSFHGDEEGWLGGCILCPEGTVLASSGLKDHLWASDFSLMVSLKVTLPVFCSGQSLPITKPLLTFRIQELTLAMSPKEEP